MRLSKSQQGCFWPSYLILLLHILHNASFVVGQPRAGPPTPQSASDYFVTSLPGAPPGDLLRMHAGLIEVAPEHHGNIFFWQFDNRHLANRHRTVLWFNGGPGCSSMDGALMEIGPYRLKDRDNLEYNPGSWHEFANLIFVDSPVGTGYSYIDTDSYQHELHEMADTIIVFLEKYFELFPEHQLDDIYVAGESYAGQHIPYIAKAILERNKRAKRRPAWNLSGLIIGNGWVSPREQSLAYLEYAYKEGVVKKDSDAAKLLEEQQTKCKRLLDADGNDLKISYSDCESILIDMLRLTSTGSDPGKKRCTNMYDIRLDDTFPSCGMNWPPDLAYMKPWLRKKEVVSALHADADKRPGWVECSGSVSGSFKARNSKPSIDLLPELLTQVPILFFSGQKDLICSHIGTEEFIHNLEWNGGKGFELSPGTWARRRDWTFEGELAGIWQEARNLTYVLFYNASHMVPFDYPRRTRDMLDRFMQVDIASIGGRPADSRIDGQKGLETSVGGHPNSTAAEKEEEAKLDQERWSAYYRSGAIALVVVAILASCFAWYVWQDRRRRAGYMGLLGGEQPGAGGGGGGGAGGSVRFASAQAAHAGRKAAGQLFNRDVEAGDLEENELDTLPRETRYSLGGVSDEEDLDEDPAYDDQDHAHAHAHAARSKTVNGHTNDP